MTEIHYCSLIDCDTEGTEKVAMIPTPNGEAVKARNRMWLEEMIPHHFRLYTQNSTSADTFNILCPRCGATLKCIGGAIDETKRCLYVCSACAKS